LKGNPPQLQAISEHLGEDLDNARELILRHWDDPRRCKLEHR
jgi:hypothetical protein